MDTRERIVEAAAALLAREGADQLSIRDVCAAAGVGAPTVYHHFGDKQGLLDAVVAHGFERYIATKRAEVATADPLADLRSGWDAHTGFATANPAFYALMYGTVRPGRQPPAAAEAMAMLEAVLRRVEQTVGLRLPVPEAARLVLAANVGVALALVTEPAMPGAEALSARAREAAIEAIVPPRRDDRDRPLSAAEEAVLEEWLRRRR